ncbi:MAG TPA: C40 family peptidase [Gemmatimonadales bacterium]|nr:C40 family peptidase [Gemmatimonadales bacterium]
MRPPTELALLVACGPALLAAQGRDVEVVYGRWYQGNRASTYELRTDAPLGRGGTLSHGFAVQVQVHDSLGRRRAFYGAGWELHALRRRATIGPYIIAGATLGLSTDTTDQALAALWSVGGGVEWRPVSWVAVGAEARYRLEDRGPRGFWHPAADARKGVSLAVGLSVPFVGRTTAPRPGARPTPRLPPPQPPLMIVGSAGDVVRTALDALGTPYQWGGTAANGFDCSGLIQYAYGQHGIRLPRRSREQAQAGAEVPPVVDALKPGDILLFAAYPGGGITHVGMYVGEQKFIHSSNTGVKLSRLELHDPDGAWWLERWVGARRLMP